jgi:hypothetical protein
MFRNYHPQLVYFLCEAVNMATQRMSIDILRGKLYFDRPENFSKNIEPL